MQVPNMQFLDCRSGQCLPLVGGFLYSYAAGTSTPLGTCATSALTGSACTTPNANPVVLNSSGFNQAGSGSTGIWPLPFRCYKYVLQDSSNVTLWTIDNLCSIPPGAGYIVYTGPSLATACAAAAAAGAALAIATSNVPSPSDQTCAAPLLFLGNGSIEPSSGTTVTFTVQSAGLTTICDISLGGTCAITSADGWAHPEYAGARADNSTASKAGIDWACAQNQPTLLQAGSYLYAGKMTCLTGTTGKTIMGFGGVLTNVFCTDSSQSACVEIASSNTTNGLTIQGIHWIGPGIALGSMRGFYSHGGGSANNHYTFRDVQFSDFSSDGIASLDAFMTGYYETWVGNIGGNGIVSDGDQSATFINSGHYNYNVVGYCWWVKSGAPFMQGMNAGGAAGAGCGAGGAHFGVSGGSETAYPTIIGMNVESVTGASGECITFESSSNFAYIAGSGLQCYVDTVSGGAVIHWHSPMGQPGMVIGQIRGYTLNGGSWASPNYVADGCTTNSGLFSFSFAAGLGALGNSNFGTCLSEVTTQADGKFHVTEPVITSSAASVTATGTGTGPGSATSNTQITTVTTPSMTTAAGGNYSVSLSNTLAGTGSHISCTLNGGTYTTGTPSIVCTPGVQVVTVTLFNVSPSAAFNGTVIFTVKVE